MKKFIYIPSASTVRRHFVPIITCCSVLSPQESTQYLSSVLIKLGLPGTASYIEISKENKSILMATSMSGECMTKEAQAIARNIFLALLTSLWFIEEAFSSHSRRSLCSQPNIWLGTIFRHYDNCTTKYLLRLLSLRLAILRQRKLCFPPLLRIDYTQESLVTAEYLSIALLDYIRSQNDFKAAPPMALPS